MNVAQVLAMIVTAVASVVVFLLMRYSHLRRAQFQGGRRFSTAVSVACAAALFIVFAQMSLLQQ